ncbi:hypothetical protein H9X78_09485 [Clostridium saudiense]|nr:hypothetical protein [Clostridium saudiense]
MRVKRRILCMLIVATAIFSVGCSSQKDGEDKDLSANITDALNQQSGTSSNYFWESDMTDDTIAIIVNKFTEEQYKALGETTKVVLQEDSKDKFLIVSAEDNTNVEIWSGQYENDKFVEKELECEMTAIKKNTVVEVQASRSEGTPTYKIKFSNSKGELEYYLTEDLKDGNPNIEYLTIDIQNNSNSEEKVETELKDSNEANSKLTIQMFIPNGNYEIKYDASDLVSNNDYVSGNGSAYQVIGTNGKGPYVNVYEAKDNGLYRVFTGDLTEDEMASVETINYLDKRENTEEVFLLNEPIAVGTRWDNKEIVEVGENLELGDLTLEGAYVKTWEKEVSDGIEYIKVYYYSEGLGCVQHRVLQGETVVEYSIAKEVIKK